MSLSELADLATVAATTLAVLGVGWLIFVHIKRHRQVKEDLEFIVERWKESGALYDDVFEVMKSDKTPAQLERIAVVWAHLNYISSQLDLLLQVSMAEYLRKHVSDEQVASFLAEWKLRSPIVRRREQQC